MPWSVDAKGDPVWVEAPAGAPAGAPPAPAAAVPTGRKVSLVNPAGGIEDVDEGGVQAALSTGRYKLATPEQVQKHDTAGERGGAVEALTTFGETAVASAFDALSAPAAALRTISSPENFERAAPGGREALRKIVGGLTEEGQQEYDKAARERAERHAFAALAGNITGSVVGGLAFGGAGAAAGKALGGGRVAAAVGTGIAEGAVQNVASAREEAYIENHELTGESLLAAMGWGALVGGGVGFAAGKAGQLFNREASRGATAFDSPRAPGAGTDAASALPEVSVPGAAATADAPGAFGERFASKLRDFAEERTAKAIGARGTDIRKLGKTGEKARTELHRMTRDVLDGELEDGTKIFSALQSKDKLVANLNRAREESGAALGAFRDKVGSYIDDGARELRPKTSAIADRIEKEIIEPLASSAVPQMARRADDVRGIVDGLRGLGDDVSLEQLTRVRKDLASVIYPKPVGPGLPPMPPNSVAELQRAERLIEEHIEATIDKAATKMGGDNVARYGELKAKFRSFREASQIAGKADLQDLGNRVVSPTDYLAGGAVFAADAASGGALSAIKAGAALALHKGLREHSSSVMAVLAERLAKTVERKTSKALDGFFERSLGAAAKARPVNDNARRSLDTARLTRAVSPLALFMGRETDKQEAYRKRVQEINGAGADFGAVVRERTEAALGDLPQKAPKVAAAMATAATRGQQFLASKIPVPLVSPGELMPSRPPPVSEYAIQKFARYWSAVSNPASVLDDFRLGRVTPEQIEALRVVYPQFYRSVQRKVVDRLRDLEAKGASVPYHARLQLDTMLSLNGAAEPTATPEFVQRFQQLKAARPGGGQAPRPTPPAHPINIATRLRSGRDQFDPAGKS